MALISISEIARNALQNYIRQIGKAGPAVIIQNDIGNKFSPVTIIAPISSAKEITKPNYLQKYFFYN